jgi:hypothetical protein
MNRSPLQIKRPRLLGAMASLSASAGLAACMSLLVLATALEGGPVQLQAGAERLEATLSSGPVVASGGDGPIIWALTAPDCAECRDFATVDIAELRAEGFDVRLVSLRPGGVGPRHRAIAAVAAANGADMRLPALIWRSGGEWRAAFGRGSHASKLVRADLGPEA